MIILDPDSASKKVLDPDPQHCAGSGSTTLCRVLEQEIYVVNAPDIELSWVGEFTNGVHQKVPENVSICF